jgi:hypothetical protein
MNIAMMLWMGLGLTPTQAEGAQFALVTMNWPYSWEGIDCRLTRSTQNENAPFLSRLATQWA